MRALRRPIEHRCVPASTGVALLLAVSLLTGCANFSVGAPASVGQGAAPPAPKAMRAVILAQLPGVISQFTKVLPGADSVMAMVAGGLTIMDDTGHAQPQLAEQLPSLDNGLWAISPDGTMETTWKLKDGLVWHDGQPFTSDDLVFTLVVARDPVTVGWFRGNGYALIDSVAAPDPRTLVLHWKAPFIDADKIMSTETGAQHKAPLPRHLFEQPFNENKAGMLDLAYWAEGYIGTGPYKLEQWVGGSYFTLGAFDRFALGRPKIDQIQVDFAPDPNAAIARILSGYDDMILGRGLDIKQATDAADHWPDGKLDFGFKSWVVVWPQFINPNPPVIANLQFRQALMHALDRKAMVDTLLNGLTGVADSYLAAQEPEYPYFAQRITRYPYDPARAAQMIEGLGYAKAADGFFRDRGGQLLGVELRTIGDLSIQLNSALAAGNDWKQLGVQSDVVPIPQQLQNNLEYRFTRPGFELVQGRNDLTALAQWRGEGNTALPETGYVGDNYSRYINPGFDALINRYFGTIAETERIEVVAQIMEHISANLNAMGLFYNAEFSLIANRLLNARARQNGISNQTWNVHAWDVR